MNQKEPFWTIPNILSLYRIVAFPVILVIAFKEYEHLFAILLLINLITDILDGFIARTFNMATKIGARLDSLADIGSYILAVTGMVLFKWVEVAPHKFMLYLFLCIYLLPEIYAFLKYKTYLSFHIYSCKIGGYLQGFFFFLLFFFGFFPVYYYFVLIWGCLSFIEETLIIYFLKEKKSDVKGLYWVLRELKEK
jgi:CDP-diacylglycerol--glycerol-3-phosphate 3-phosphatidyltransferase